MDFEGYNTLAYGWINYCPSCGVRVLKRQREELHKLVTDEEIGEMIKEHVLEYLSGKEGGDVSADELGYGAWESENVDGVVFNDNYKADRFVARHGRWVDDALEYVCETFGEGEHYAKMKAECNNRFLVAAFICATEHFLFDRLEVDRDEGDLSRTRIKEIMRLVKSVPYDGNFE
jgi:hypothetical protein